MGSVFGTDNSMVTVKVRADGDYIQFFWGHNSAASTNTIKGVMELDESMLKGGDDGAKALMAKFAMMAAVAFYSLI